MLIGYRRSSTTEQIAGYEAQEAALLATGCTRIFGEMVSSVAQRDQLEAAFAFARDGDVLITCRLDWLSRGTADFAIHRGSAGSQGCCAPNFGLRRQRDQHS